MIFSPDNYKSVGGDWQTGSPYDLRTETPALLDLVIVENAGQKNRLDGEYGEQLAVIPVESRGDVLLFGKALFAAGYSDMEEQKGFVHSAGTLQLACKYLQQLPVSEEKNSI